MVKSHIKHFCFADKDDGSPVLIIRRIDRGQTVKQITASAKNH